jgi:hypothetical protein
MKKSSVTNISEFAVNICSSGWLMMPANQLGADAKMSIEHQKTLKNCHIYLITKTPSLRFAPESFKYEDGTMSGHITYRVKGELRKIPFHERFPLLDGAIELRLSEYPHREVQTFDADGNEVKFFPASRFQLHLDDNELRHLEILYIGQAYGNGAKSAFDRLQAHSTLQKILAEIQYHSPDDEASILMFEYEPYRVISQFNGRIKADERERQIDEKRLEHIYKKLLTPYQQICLTEAALIRYFQPQYNKDFKNNFPSKKHKTLKACYDLDFSALIVEINTEELGFSLFSDIAPPKDHHISQIDLVGHENRAGFLYTFDGSKTKYPNVISGT